ncbi:MAG: hypothetical protein IJ538_00855 [Clostridia bacterium]|nr:hypothetical protein [Clostridia bacterium]
MKLKQAREIISHYHDLNELNEAVAFIFENASAKEILDLLFYLENLNYFDSTDRPYDRKDFVLKILSIGDKKVLEELCDERNIDLCLGKNIDLYSRAMSEFNELKTQKQPGEDQ